MRCSVEQCDRYSKVKGYCRAHYQQVYHNGRITNPILGHKPAKAEQYCTVAGCDKPLAARGVCHSHYGQLRRHGEIVNEVLGPYNEGPSECIVDDCENYAHGKDYCRKHYDRIRKTGSVFLTPKKPKITGGPCTMEGCERPVRCSGLCASHYAASFRK